MTEQELSKICGLSNAAIEAPAGHGKTEMIVDIVEHTNGRQLLLTHTHAGVDALQKRLHRRKVPKEKYAISTIAAFCIKWGLAFHNSASIDKDLSPYEKNAGRYYSQFYDGAKTVFENLWAGDILRATYSGIIVDEYQDCSLAHHKMFLVLNRYIPVIVLGDPLQGIFSLGEPLVDWGSIEFNKVNVQTYPWRWRGTNPLLGQYLTAIRGKLLPTLSGQICQFDIQTCNNSITFIDSSQFNPYALLKGLSPYRSVLYVAKWERQQIEFSNQMAGIFQVDEKQDCELLYRFSNLFDSTHGSKLMRKTIEFIEQCATKVNKEVSSYINRLDSASFDFSRIKKHQDFGKLLVELQEKDRHEVVAQICNWFKNKHEFKFYRKELYYEMLRSIDYSRVNNISILDAALKIRKDSSLQKRYPQFRCLASRTLLSKGLEFDCVIIDNRTVLTAKEFYVAMTRAMKKIYIISSSTHLILQP